MLRCERSEPRPFEARLRRAPQGEEITNGYTLPHAEVRAERASKHGREVGNGPFEARLRRAPQGEEMLGWLRLAPQVEERSG